MKLSVLIVNWRSKDYLEKCLHALYPACEHFETQVVVVDGASFDGCDEMLAAKFPAVKFVQSQENVGFGGCNNLGLPHVAGEYLLLLNPDTEPRRASVATLLAALQELPDAGMAGPRLLNSDGTLQASCVQALPTPLNQALDANLLRRLFPRLSIWRDAALHAPGAEEVEAISGACMLLKTETFRRVGGFSPEYFMYAEDLDLCWKVRQLGLKVYHVPTAEVVHHGGGSSGGSFGKRANVILHASVHRFIRKSQGSAAACFHRSLLTLSSLVRILILLPTVILTGDPNKSGRRRGALRKWTAILRWSITTRVPAAN